MRTIYVNSDFECHISNDGTLTAVKTSSFDDKCDTFVEGCRFVPEGKSWTRRDGVVFQGEMFSPWKPYSELAAAQAQYERDMAELAAAYQEGVNSV